MIAWPGVGGGAWRAMAAGALGRAADHRRRAAGARWLSRVWAGVPELAPNVARVERRAARAVELARLEITTARACSRAAAQTEVGAR